jgi:RNA polymerase sigma-70 factor (ECF subfamily)
MRSPAGWTFRVALNAARRRLRKEQRLRNAMARETGSTYVAGYFDQSSADLRALLDRLPERQRLAVVLRYGADLAESEIAHLMGISRGAVSASLVSARRTLREHLGEEGAHDVD